MERFNDLVLKFLHELQIAIPEYKDLKIYKAQIESALYLDKRIVIKNFMKYVLPHEKEILAKDEHYFLDQDVDDYLSQALHIKELWKSKLSDENKEVVWRYFKVLINLAKRYNVSKTV